MVKRVKVKLNVGEMSDADAHYISLVDRPANRAPFRITKAQGQQALEGDIMGIDVGKAFMRARKRDGEATENTGDSPAVSAIVVAKAQREQIEPKLAAAGYKTDDVIEHEHAAVFKQAEGLNEADCNGAQITEGVAVLFERVEKAFDPYPESLSFNDNLVQGGFWPSFWNAQDALADTFRTALRSAEEPAEAQVLVAQAVNDFAGFVSGLVENLPNEAFTIYKAVSSEAVPAVEDEKAAATKADESPSVEAEPESGSKAEGAETTATKSEQEPGQPDMAALVKSAMGESLQPLTDRLGAIETQVTDFGTRVSTVEKAASDATEAVAGSAAAVEGDDPPPRVQTRKSSDFWAGTGLDKLIG